MFPWNMNKITRGFLLALVPAFTFYLPSPPVISRVITAPEVITVPRLIDTITYGMCELPAAKCAIHAALHPDATLRVEWICKNLGGECAITRNGVPFLSVSGEGYLDNLPSGKDPAIIFRIAAPGNNCVDMTTLTR